MTELTRVSEMGQRIQIMEMAIRLTMLWHSRVFPVDNLSMENIRSNTLINYKKLVSKMSEEVK